MEFCEEILREERISRISILKHAHDPKLQAQLLPVETIGLQDQDMNQLLGNPGKFTLVGGDIAKVPAEQAPQRATAAEPEHNAAAAPMDAGRKAKAGYRS
ncbi:uncharacterized protein VTP21DRAFT_2123 [Calcarisporiella thermophila]|uniref:uncharacterized protein n=1 Tax=Calcarisporiella thermophila TaxID=911321 RepID=UPI003742D8D7